MSENKGYDEDEVLSSLLYVAHSLDKSPTSREYENFRKKNPDLHIPNKDTVISKCGGWNNAKKRAGLEIYTKGTKRESFEEYYQEVKEQFGKLPSPAEYRRYKEENGRGLPSWKKLMDEAIEDHDLVPDYLSDQMPSKTLNT